MGQGSNLSGFLSCQIPQNEKDFWRARYSLLSYTELRPLPLPNLVTSSEFCEYSYYILILLLQCVYSLSTPTVTKAYTTLLR